MSETQDTGAARPKEESWISTACILCSQNCGVQVQIEEGRIARVRGDRAHPVSQGYACEKAQRLDYYQSSKDRLASPLRRRADGSFEAIDWDTAIREIAEKFSTIRREYGGETIFYYGGGGQGNHLGGAYGRATRAALGSVFSSNALAQEKTGEFWVDGQLFGRPRCHTAPDFEHAEVAVFVGKNPWQSHGFPRARPTLREISKDPARCLIVIDPRRTETAELADIHLQLRPGTDAWCLGALLGVLVQEDLVNATFLADRTSGADELLPELRGIPVAAYCAHCDVPEELLRKAARRIAAAKSVSVLEDLGIQQAPHSTLNSYLEKLLYILTGNFAKRGGVNIHTSFVSLGGGEGGGSRTSPVGGHRIITGLIPANVIPDEILTDHPKRFRGMLVESGNPAHSLADSQRMRTALSALDLLVVIDVAMTETARLAHYVLPAASQFEKWECTFFTLEFPENAFHLRAPLFEPLPGTLPEAEIHRRLVRALGAIRDEDLVPLHEAAKKIPREGRGAYLAEFLRLTSEKPEYGKLVPIVLYETLGPTLPVGAEATALLWGAAQICAMSFPESVRRAGFSGQGNEPAERLFEAILAGPTAVVFSSDDYEESWRRVVTPDGKIRLVVPELMPELHSLRELEPLHSDPDFPFILAAGERRSNTANTIFRNPGWRKKDYVGALRMNPSDAGRIGARDGGKIRLTTRRASIEAVVELSETLRPGHLTLPNGLGLDYPSDRGDREVVGVAPNELTSSADRDWLAGTPWHKFVPARVEAIE